MTSGRRQDPKPFTVLAVIVFSLIALLQLRFIVRWEVTLDGAVVPVWLSGIAFVVAGGLVTLLALSAGAYALRVRPRMLRRGASAEEVRHPYPGADLIPGGQRRATIAVTIDAPPSRVWLWLVQAGCDRAGWYSWDRLDNGGVPNAERIHPEWQNLTVGDRLASTPSGSAWFEVVALDPERFLGLRAPINLRAARPFDTAGPRPRFYLE